MRHGHLSDIHGNSVFSPAAAGGDEGAQAGCPVAHFSNLFTASAASKPGAAAADKKAIGVIADARASGVDDPPSDDRDNIPAGYTYFGQLVVHDLTQSRVATGADGRETLQNLVTPNLDLDTIYGGGPTRCPHIYQPPYQAPYQKWPDDPRDDGQHMFYLGR